MDESCCNVTLRGDPFELNGKCENGMDHRPLDDRGPCFEEIESLNCALNFLAEPSE